jgi:hypothetical protein
MGRYADYSQLIPSDNGPVRSGLSFVDYLYDGRIIYHTVESQEDGRPDLIAYRYLNDPHLYWVVLLFNQIGDPLSIVPGMDLAIPIDPVVNRSVRAFTYPGVAE